MGVREKLHALRKDPLLVNTAMLYLLSFSNALLTFVTQGYLTRIVGIGRIGILGAARYTTNFFQLFIDFGFILSATAKVSRRREDKAYLSRTLTCVVGAKLLFMLTSSCILLVFILPGVGEDPGAALAYWSYLLYVCMVALLPDFIYRGLERMKEIAVKAVLIKIVATLLVFVAVRQPGDYWLSPLLSALGNAGATAFVYWHLKKRLGIWFCRVSLREIFREMKEGAQFFLSNVAMAVNTNLNGVLLKNLSGALATGLYTQADVVITAARGAMTPIADSLYANTVHTRNFKVIRKTLLTLYPVVLAGCVFVFFAAPWLLTAWLGPEAGPQSVLPLRLLLPVAVFAFPNYLLGYPPLSPIGLTKHANLAVAFGTGVYLVGLLVCWVTVGIRLESLCVLSSLTEFSILAYRVVIVLRNRHLFQPEHPTPALEEEED